MIYFVKPVGETGPIKIGSAKDPIERLAGLQLASPVALEIVALLDSVPSLERALQHKFAESHRHGEWFDWSPALQALIDNHSIEPIAGPLRSLPPKAKSLFQFSGNRFYPLPSKAGYDRADELMGAV